MNASLAFRTAAIKPLKVESQKTASQAVRNQKSSSQQSEAKLIIETSFVKEEATNYKQLNLKPSEIGTKPQTTKLSPLDKIRKQLKAMEIMGTEVKQLALPLNWKVYKWHGMNMYRN